ncbi:MAG: glycerol-3-phosphate dehydrogenase/oxidase [Thermodesulfobacteriota bacterium]
MESMSKEIASGTFITVDNVARSWDLIVIGGGITGAAVFREAVRMGLRVLLMEQEDFAWGTSSRSSKMVHGGLRYLKEGKVLLTRASVKERQRLLGEVPGLVDPLGFMMPVYSDGGPSKTLMGVGLSVYSLMALEKQHIGYSAARMAELVPGLRTENLTGGFYFKDAQVDDARLVLRLIQEGQANGGTALNYTRVQAIGRDSHGKLASVTAQDTETGASAELSTKAVVNATGAWADRLGTVPEPGVHLRPLRGSHMVFPASVFPLDKVVSFIHPADHRPVFIFPWEGTAFLGTTDVDHERDLNTEPVITRREVDYLMEGLDFILPGLNISESSCIATMAGVRPVLSHGRAAASAESREHAVWDEKGMVTMTGGKLTTFRLLANDALKAARDYLPATPLPSRKEPVFDAPKSRSRKMDQVKAAAQQRLYGRYGEQANALVEGCVPDLLTPVFSTDTLWAEIDFAARHGQVRHLSDLLLRRVRIGVLLAEGGAICFERLEPICKSALGWSQDQWEAEKAAYMKLWNQAYAPPAVLFKADEI